MRSTLTYKHRHSPDASLQKHSCPWQGIGDDLQGPFKTKPFFDSMINLPVQKYEDNVFNLTSYSTKFRGNYISQGYVVTLPLIL